MITYYDDVIQGDDEWLRLHIGTLTAGSTKLILTPTLKVASNEKERQHFYELLAQRISQHIEPSYIGDDMIRGMDDEIRARDLYSEKFAPVKQTGFVTNDKWGFVIGCSPDGLVGDDGMIECKSRRQKYQIETILSRKAPDEFMLQIQTSLLVTERKWCDFISYSGGLPMYKFRVYPMHDYFDAIVAAATALEVKLQDKLHEYRLLLETDKTLIPTERHVEQEMFL